MVKSPFEGGKFKLTSPYGNRVLNGRNEFHGGVDLVGISSRNIIAAKGGEVIRSQIITDRTNATWQWGNYVCVRVSDGGYHYYCHMASRAVAVGDRVNAGDRIGVMGNTGYSFGAHLHFEARDTDGRKTLNAAEVLGIENRTGTYIETNIEGALEKLARARIIDTPNYWRAHKNDLEYLPELIVKISENVDENTLYSGGDKSFGDALNVLAAKGVINSPSYWEREAAKVKYLDLLIIKSAAALTKV